MFWPPPTPTSFSTAAFGREDDEPYKGGRDDDGAEDLHSFFCFFTLSEIMRTEADAEVAEGAGGEAEDQAKGAFAFFVEFFWGIEGGGCRECCLEGEG